MKQNTILTLVLSLMAPMLLFGQKVYELTAPKQPKQIVKKIMGKARLTLDGYPGLLKRSRSLLPIARFITS